MTKYVIYKSTRLPRADSYFGPAWDAAGIRHLYKPQYDDVTEVHEIAGMLSEHNQVGFWVAEVKEED